MVKRRAARTCPHISGLLAASALGPDGDHTLCLQRLLGAQASSMLRRLQISRLTALRRGRRHVASLSQVLARHAPVDVHPEVQEALNSQSPVVALETTIVTHGMPYPTNLETAQTVEKMVRDQGAIPATIGIIGGRVKIGLEPGQLEYLANVENDPPAAKISRRDIAAAIATKRDGGTTCSATLIFAAMAGIKVRERRGVLLEEYSKCFT